MASIDAIDFIRTNLPLAPVPGIPEIHLHKALPSSGLGRLADAGLGSPYWAYYWAGGLALARHILDHPETVAGRRVLDLGAGSGLVAIAAAKAGASAVIAAEVDPFAVAALSLNIARNEVAVSVVHADLTAGGLPRAAEVVLVGDLFYERDLAERVTAFLDRCLADGAHVLVGDPWRASLPRTRLRLLAEYEVAETDSSAAKASAVFAFEPKPA